MTEEDTEQVKDNTTYFDLSKKKKKKKKPQDDYENVDSLVKQAEPLTVEERGDKRIIRTGCFSQEYYRDYEYKELLGRVFNELRENNLEITEDRRRTVMRPPQVLSEGMQKTVCVNFVGLCRTMHRKPEHVMNFLLAEMGTRGSLDGQQRLVLKGRPSSKYFEEILRRYIYEYVLCNCCKCPDTILAEKNRQFFLRCELCGSERPMASIKVGFC